MTEPTTRELLEGAARAMGGTLSEGHTKRRTGETWDEWEWIGEPGIAIEGRTIHPLTSSRDCADMEAVLLLEVEWCTDHVNIGQANRDGEWCIASAKYSDHNNDRKAARMYASTRCAFEISKGMK